MHRLAKILFLQLFVTIYAWQYSLAEDYVVRAIGNGSFEITDVACSKNLRAKGAAIACSLK